MATIPPGTEVVLSPGEAAKLRFPPPDGARLYVAVHPAALNAGERSRLTQLIGLVDGDVHWVGAVDERMLDPGRGDTLPGARSRISRCFFGEDERWDIIWPGILAAPLNDARGNPKWWAPRIDAADLEFVGGKEAQVELAHLWTVEDFQMRGGAVSSRARAEIEHRVRAYVS
jgi:hypothetical protein